jgi:hypothetical protein
MRSLVYIYYRAAWFLAGIPPDTLGATVLFALEHPGLITILVAAVFSVLKFVVVAILGSIVTWYVAKMLGIHVWPRLPHSLQRLLRRLEDRALLKSPERKRATAREAESAFSRNSKRHPHW